MKIQTEMFVFLLEIVKALSVLSVKQNYLSYNTTHIYYGHIVLEIYLMGRLETIKNVLTFVH